MPVIRSTLPHQWNRWSRRDVLQIGALTAFGLSFSDVLRLQRLSCAADPQTRQPAKSCILIWLDGGPSHLETFDLKPNAPREVRGPLESISTSLPGIGISECLLRTATLLNEIAIIRSMTSPLGEHNLGTHYLMTGYKPSSVLEYPTYGGVCAELLNSESALPPNVAVPDFRVGGGNLTGSGFLSAQTRPFSLGADPSKADFQVRDLRISRGLTLDRLNRRRHFTTELDRMRSMANGQGGTADVVDPDLQRAFDLISSSEAQSVFQLNDESPELRSRYGPKSVGQSCLLARRLIEKGVRFVTVNHHGWDTHNDMYTRLKEGYTGARTPVGLIPSLDLALSALIQDLKERRLLDETLIVVMGEFGRTPKLNVNGGRDHWPRVFSVALAGGGIQGGQVIGASDASGESPKDRPVTPSDLAATIYTLLGIDPKLELQTPDGRPVRLTPPEATVVDELIA
ncbi:hypothetical protein KOR42_12490 [Thalassoglobus neptunius]|uniref:Sulfatase n=1 Tax=Thalassoglobus neptunius TaxID=1938619 RepID=A0A5C5X780_9PLAN|nr:DUF1501 domain-containing protein [Thalassoglobus neptunius]TWT57882.1 hypothetical protein KOR42_12490 [Thalassoglobus neptunius]